MSSPREATETPSWLVVIAATVQTAAVVWFAWFNYQLAVNPELSPENRIFTGVMTAASIVIAGFLMWFIYDVCRTKMSSGGGIIHV